MAYHVLMQVAGPRKSPRERANRARVEGYLAALIATKGSPEGRTEDEVGRESGEDAPAPRRRAA